jgi:hypothetical protein
MRSSYLIVVVVPFDYARCATGRSTGRDRVPCHVRCSATGRTAWQLSWLVTCSGTPFWWHTWRRGGDHRSADDRRQGHRASVCSSRRHLPHQPLPDAPPALGVRIRRPLVSHGTHQALGLDLVPHVFGVRLWFWKRVGHRNIRARRAAPGGSGDQQTRSRGLYRIFCRPISWQQQGEPERLGSCN